MPGSAPSEDVSQVTDLVALHRTYRSYIEHENGLIDQRMKSGLAIHGFLFTFYGLALTRLTSAASATDGLLRPTLTLAWQATLTIGIVGISAAIITAASIGAAVLTIVRLSHRWETLALPRADSLGLPRMSGAGSNLAMILGFGTTLALPALIVGCWIAVLIITLPSAGVIGNS